KGGGLGDGRPYDGGVDADAGGEGGQELHVGGTDGGGRTGVGLVEVGGELDEVGDGHLPVVIDVAFLPGAGLVEMGGEGDEVGDGGLAIQIEVAGAGGADEDVEVAVDIGHAGQAQLHVGVQARVIDAV